MLLDSVKKGKIPTDDLPTIAGAVAILRGWQDWSALDFLGQ